MSEDDQTPLEKSKVGTGTGAVWQAHFKQRNEGGFQGSDHRPYGFLGQEGSKQSE